MGMEPAFAILGIMVPIVNTLIKLHVLIMGQLIWMVHASAILFMEALIVVHVILAITIIPLAAHAMQAHVLVMEIVRYQERVIVLWVSLFQHVQVVFKVIIIIQPALIVIQQQTAALMDLVIVQVVAVVML